MKIVYLLVALVAAVGATTPHPATKQERKCIDGCKCTLDSSYTLKISRCTRDISLTDDVFVHFDAGELNTVEFSGAVIYKTEKNAFAPLKNLKTLAFKNSHIDEIQEDAFDLPQIDKISFTGCSFNGTVPRFNSDQVTEVILTRCNLMKMPEFGDLPSLELLDLSHNYIKKMNKDAFEELESLESLNLSNNNITVLPPDVFYDNPSLSTLKLDNNPLRFFNLDSDLSLEYLSLKSCKLTTFDRTTVKCLNSLTELYLNGNKIAFFPNDAIENMTDLEIIDLSSNNLKHLDANVFRKNGELAKIILDGNNFRTLPPFSIANGTFSVSYFSCRECGIRSLSKDTFKHMPSIQILYLSHNFLDNIDNVLKDIPSLVELDLSYNEMVMINTNTFNANHNLKTLRLRGNPLFQVNPKTFINNKVLSLIDISDTDLVQIWATNNTKLPSVETLIVSNNKIKSVSPADLEVTPNLRHIYLERNRFTCTQNFKDSLKWLSVNEVFRLAETDKDQHDIAIGGNIKTWRQLGKDICPKDQIFHTPEKVKEIRQEYLGADEDGYVEITVPDGEKLDNYGDSDYYDYYEDEDTTTHFPNVVEHKTMKNPSTKSNQQIDEVDEDEDLGYEEVQAAELESKYTLTKTSYVILVTAIFMLTALLVIFITVSVTMLILKKNRNMQIQRANLPRFKIPLWSALPAQRKHSGSVYQTLTEDCSGPKTPKINRYEFKSTPTVHTHSSA